MNSINTDKTPLQVLAETTKHVFTTLDGLYYFAELVNSILETIGKTFANMPTSLKNTQVSVQSFIGFSTAFEFINQLWDWVFPEKIPKNLEGKIQHFSGKVLDSIKSILDFIGYLEELEFFTLLKRLPGIDYISGMLALFSTGTGLWKDARTLIKLPAKESAIAAKIGMWKESQPYDSALNIYSKKFTKYKINKSEDYEKFRNYKIEKLEIAKTNARNKKIKSAFGVACQVGYMIGVIFSILALPQLTIPLLIFYVLINSAYCAHTIMNTLLLKKPLPSYPWTV